MLTKTEKKIRTRTGQRVAKKIKDIAPVLPVVKRHQFIEKVLIMLAAVEARLRCGRQKH